MQGIEQVKVDTSEYGAFCMSCISGAVRYHVWLDRKTREPEREVLFKNSIADREEPGYFQTRRLNLSAPDNQRIYRKMRDEAVRYGMFEKAEAVIVRQKEIDALAAAERKRQKLIQEAAPELFAIVERLAEWYESSGYNGNGPSGAALLFEDDETFGTHVRAALLKAKGGQ